MTVYAIDHVVCTGGNCTAQGKCWYEEVCPTLKTGGVHAVMQMAENRIEKEHCSTSSVIAFDRATYNQGQNAQYDMGIDDSGTAHTVIAKGPGGGVCYSMQRSDEYAESPVASMQSARQYKSVTDIVKEDTLDNEQQYIVRRLTPTECARLQGMPDWWVEGIENPNPTEDEMTFWREVWETYRLAINPKAKPKTDKQIRKWLADPHSDSAEYKMWGNGMALPCVLYVMEGIKTLLDNTGNA